MNFGWILLDFRSLGERSKLSNYWGSIFYNRQVSIETGDLHSVTIALSIYSCCGQNRSGSDAFWRLSCESECFFASKDSLIKSVKWSASLKSCQQNVYLLFERIWVDIAMYCYEDFKLVPQEGEKSSTCHFAYFL